MVRFADKRSSVSFNSFRKMCSGDRRRFQDEEFNLDLTYITPQLVAMAFPAEGIESAWRNHIDDVAKMLNTNHKNHYVIWNLSDKKYNYEKFGNNVMEFGFPDHHSPPLDVLFKIILTMHNWLKVDPDNIAVVHCVVRILQLSDQRKINEENKGGKGRTGTVICCFLYFSGFFDDPNEALDFFAQKRSKTANGVKQPSQRRYVRYFDEILRSSIRPIAPTLLLSKIVLNTIPIYDRKKKGCSPCLNVFQTSSSPGELIYSSAWEQDVSSVFFQPKDEKIEWKINALVCGDFMITCRHADGSSGSTLMFRASLHTAFVCSIVILPLEELDGVKYKKGISIDEGLYLEIHFVKEDVPELEVEGVTNQEVYEAIISEFAKLHPKEGSE